MGRRRRKETKRGKRKNEGEGGKKKEGKWKRNVRERSREGGWVLGSCPVGAPVFPPRRSTGTSEPVSSLLLASLFQSLSRELQLALAPTKYSLFSCLLCSVSPCLLGAKNGGITRSKTCLSPGMVGGALLPAESLKDLLSPGL